MSDKTECAARERALYQILQWTPFPGRLQPIPEWQLQAAEYDLKLNGRRYYETASRQGQHIRYPLKIANRIVAYWQDRWPFAKYQLQEN